MQTPTLPQTATPGTERSDPKKGTGPLTSQVPSPFSGEAPRLDFSRIAQDLQIRKVQVESVVQLLDEGNTVPFITRYRKERTGGLNEEIIRLIQGRVVQLRQLAERKQTILKSIEGQGKLTDELRSAIIAAENPKRLEDLYLPYKPKKRTLATTARERGLEPLALAVWNKDPAVANLAELLPTLVAPEKELHTPDDVLLGVGHILAEQISETASVRAAIRALLWDHAKLCTAKSEKLAETEGLDYKDYFQFTEPVRHIPPHRVLAINRGEKENALGVRLDCDTEHVHRVALDKLPLADHPHAEFLNKVTADALARLLVPSLEREIRRELTTRAEQHAVTVFARNLRALLLAPPLRGRRVLAIDPGFRTGCKVACLDEMGSLLEDGVIFPHPLQHRPLGRKSAGTPTPAPTPIEGIPLGATGSERQVGVSSALGVLPGVPNPCHPSETKDEPPAWQRKRDEARHKLMDMIRRHQIRIIAIGNGTACRETEEFVSEIIAALEKQPGTDREGPRSQTGVWERGAVWEGGAPAAEPAVLSTQYSVLTTHYSVLSSQPAGVIPALNPMAVSVEASPAPSETTGPVEAVPVHAQTHVLAAPPASQTVATPFVSTMPTPAATAIPAQAAAKPAEPACPPLPPAPADLAYVIVNEAGASVYSASAVGREEFPTYDATLRGTISIGRRLQDPLSELVKIDPQNIGVGLYQHDVNPRQLKDSLDGIIESCVNQVGVDLNTASVPLLRHISGLNQLVARELVEYRKQHGPFRAREQLLQVPGIGEARFVQAAGFLKITGGENPLDRTWIHPESYPVARQLLAELGYGPDALEDEPRAEELREKLKTVSPEDVAARLQIGPPTLRDILDALARPGRDPREDLPPPIFKKGILKLEDLQPNMELKGTVLNVVDFGAFVDIGLKDSGLVHISQMANRYIKNPYEVAAVGDVVTVWVLTVDSARRRVSLTMIKPGTERKPPERKPPPPRQEQGRRDRPPRGRRPAPATGPQSRGGPPAQPQVAVPPPTTQTAPAQVAHAAPRGRPPLRGQRPPLPPRRPQRPTPKPKLSQAALEGDAPLRTFSELAAFLEAKEKVEKEPATPAAAPAVATEETPPPPPA
jgi:uncharacterized protein